MCFGDGILISGIQKNYCGLSYLFWRLSNKLQLKNVYKNFCALNSRGWFWGILVLQFLFHIILQRVFFKFLLEWFYHLNNHLYSNTIFTLGTWYTIIWSTHQSQDVNSHSHGKVHEMNTDLQHQYVNIWFSIIRVT